jgi:zinc-ribbon domain
MAYLCEPHPGQQVFVDEQAGQTQLICQRRQPGQRQEASSSFSTGTWTQPPEHWRSPQGQFIHIQSTQGHILVQIHPDGLEVLAQPNITPPIDILPLQPTDAMPPMPTGNWQRHQHHHSHVRHASSHTASASSYSTSTSRTGCPGCGKPIPSIGDRFCANCGQKLHFH